MKKHRIFFAAPVLAVALLIVPQITFAAVGDCPNGYVWDRMSGVGCKQENCGDIANAHYSYEGYCICGTSGSINESPEDPNKECSYGNENESCPGCVYACVHLDEECPGGQETDTSGADESDTDMDTAIDEDYTDEEYGDGDDDDDGGEAEDETASADAGTADAADTTGTAGTSGNQPTGVTEASAPSIPLSTSGTANTAPPGRTCEQECAKLKKGGQFDEVLEASGAYPDCKCTVDNKNKNNQITQTIQQNGDTRTTWTFDPNTGVLIKKESISLMAEKERIRERLGFTYTEDKIDQLLDDETINKWFSDKMTKIETNTSPLSPQFWWQHFVALLDHGHGNSADFVDINNYGRCGDSMMWLERNLTGQLGLTGKSNEAMLSITGENYGNITNHTALIIRPAGMGNLEWADIVSELTNKSGGGGLDARSLENIDPRLLDAKVLDPYFKKQTTVREFIKGWSVLKIS